MAKIDLETIRGLPVRERIQLVQEIWDSLRPSAEELPLTEEQTEIIRHRLEGHQRNPEDAIPWSEVKKRLGL